MGLLNIYNTIDHTHETLVANGRLKDILPDVDFNHALVIKAGNRLNGEYIVSEDDSNRNVFSLIPSFYHNKRICLHHFL